MFSLCLEQSLETVEMVTADVCLYRLLIQIPISRITQEDRTKYESRLFQKMNRSTLHIYWISGRFTFTWAGWFSRWALFVGKSSKMRMKCFCCFQFVWFNSFQSYKGVVRMPCVVSTTCVEHKARSKTCNIQMFLCRHFFFRHFNNSVMMFSLVYALVLLSLGVWFPQLCHLPLSWCTPVPCSLFHHIALVCSWCLFSNQVLPFPCVSPSCPSFTSSAVCVLKLYSLSCSPLALCSCHPAPARLIPAHLCLLLAHLMLVCPCPCLDIFSLPLDSNPLCSHCTLSTPYSLPHFFSLWPQLVANHRIKAQNLRTENLLLSAAWESSSYMCHINMCEMLPNIQDTKANMTFSTWVCSELFNLQRKQQFLNEQAHEKIS